MSSAQELWNMAKKINLDIQGIYSSSNLPNQLTSSIIVNFDAENLPGTHWVCMRRDVNNNICYFDPLLLSHPLSISNFLANQNFYLLFKNKSSNQNMFAETCGQHCIFYLHHLFPAKSEKELLKFINNI
jgi:hypothetical protein